MKFIFVVLCYLLIPSNCLTVNHTIQLFGGWCNICGGDTGNYACSNEIYGGWKDYNVFVSQAPANHVVTEVKMYLTGQWSCTYDYSTIAVSLQTREIGVQNASGLCFCGLCDEPLVYKWKEFGKCFPTFSYNGPNLVRIDVKYGLICLSKIDIEITYEPGNPVTCGCGNIGTCNIGHMRCLDKYSYETCALDNTGTASWGPKQQCTTGLTCNTTGNYIYCNPILPSEVCTPGQMRCVSNSTYQTCALNGNGNTYWQATQNCQAGLICNPDPSSQTVMCVPEQMVRGVSGECVSQTMRCVTNDTYQMCHVSGVWNPVQKCSENHYCLPSNNVIYCVTEIPAQSCTYGNMRCTSNTTYQMCNRNSTSTYWNVQQSCQPGLSCHQHDNNIYCY